MRILGAEGLKGEEKEGEELRKKCVKVVGNGRIKQNEGYI